MRRDLGECDRRKRTVEGGESPDCQGWVEGLVPGPGTGRSLSPHLACLVQDSKCCVPGRAGGGMETLQRQWISPWKLSRLI